MRFPLSIVGVRLGFTIVAAASGALTLSIPRSACAQVPAVVKTGLGFLNTGAYYFTGNAGSSGALGTPKFYNAGGYFGKPRHLGAFAVSGGIESINASDHFLPFSGGNEFNLLGPAARVSLDSSSSRIRPFVTLGLFAGRVRSTRQRFDRTEFTPSGSIGVEVALARSLSLSGSYRISREIHGVNTDGFGISLRLF